MAEIILLEQSLIRAQVNIDWAGIALERVTGMKLGEYMKQNIFEPLGIKNMAMIPTEDMKSKMAFMNHRENDGTLRPRDHLARLPAAVSSKEEAERCFNSGGGGMFAQPREYCSKSGLFTDISSSC